MSARIAFTGSQNERLRAWLEAHPEGHERAALALFRKLDRNIAGLTNSQRFVCVDVIELKDDWIVSSSETHVRINMRRLPEVYLRCEVEHLELGFVHSHPEGAHAFRRSTTRTSRTFYGVTPDVTALPSPSLHSCFVRAAGMRVHARA